MGRRYRKGVYNCMDFVREVWLDVADEDIRDRLHFMLAAITARRMTKADVRRFEKLREPAEPCIVVFHVAHREPHVGVYFRRKVLHLTQQFGVQFQRINQAALGAKRVSYYR